jgi:hypothetical protein
VCRESAVLEVVLVGACRILLDVVAPDVNAFSFNCAACPPTTCLNVYPSGRICTEEKNLRRRPCPMTSSLFFSMSL